MRFLILSDIHANGDALRAVLDSLDVASFDTVVILGDFVGYGPEPNEVVDLLRALPTETLAIRGNHDRVASGLSSTDGFNEIAARAARWTAERLTKNNRDFLRDLETGPRTIAEGTEICHGSPVDEDDYILGEDSAAEAFAATDAAVVFFGHSHLPSRFQLQDGGIDLSLLPGEGELVLEESDRYLLNPGSIGQPRDRDPRASYMTYSLPERRVTWRRVAYPVSSTVAKIRANGLPQTVASRLLVGE